MDRRNFLKGVAAVTALPLVPSFAQAIPNKALTTAKEYGICVPCHYRPNQAQQLIDRVLIPNAAKMLPPGTPIKVWVAEGENGRLDRIGWYHHTDMVDREWCDEWLTNHEKNAVVIGDYAVPDVQARAARAA